MALLKDLIEIPESVHQGDFVLKLADGVAHAERTLRDYVVTPQLAAAFDNALGFIRQAVQSNQSKASYLHASFGAGKSHFMAVLNLLLAGNAQARATPELADVVARHGWTEGRRFLLVPYHMIGATSMESAVLGQYADFVRQRHPDAPVPGFYLAGELFKNAQALRAQLGDAAFFAGLGDAGAAADGVVGGAAGEDGGWGDLDAGWTAERFDAALLAPPASDERTNLVSALITRYFPAFRSIAGHGEAFVPLDEGLAIMSRHAQALGYDAVILFLDELVLWLASHAADVAFVSREGIKLVKLVEATHADRPIPLVSFVARQRDLRELVGENLAGAMQLTFSDSLKFWEARFHSIRLEDRNLPAIAEKRILRPRDEAARQTLQAAFDGVLRAPGNVIETLLTQDADRSLFRMVYPFSPALVQTLVAVSAALQRERTALKLMQQLLVDRRDDLELGQLIPVGDLWDAIAEGDEPFSEGMRLHFENAKRLWRQRLLPMLEREHGVTWEAVTLGRADAGPATRLRNDARLLKTLLLAALVPEVESLKALTAPRLVALNHGTVRSPIPGRENQVVLGKCRAWAAEVGEIKVGDDPQPVISIQVTGVDIEPILRAAEAHDNTGNRRRKIRELLFEQLGLPDTGELFTRYEMLWRGTRREVDLVYENVRDMSDERLRGRAGAMSIVLDFPFDEPHRTPRVDIAILDRYKGGPAPTLVWLPNFLSAKAQADLGRLVVLDHLLQGDRFDSHATHLSSTDRVLAKSLARNQHDQLRIRLRTQLDVAYGVAPEPRDAVDVTLAADEQLRALDSTLSPRPPVAPDFRGAFDALMAQMLAHQFPAHPEFGTEVKPAELRRIWPDIEAAAQAPGHRHLVDDAQARRRLLAVVNPLRLGTMGAHPLVLEQHWVLHFGRQHAADGGPITVAKLRQWTERPTAMGLPREVQNLLILAWAAMTNRRFVLNGGPAEAGIDQMVDGLELVEQALPSAEHWTLAVQRAAVLFGSTLPQTLSGAHVARAVLALREATRGRRDAAQALVAALRDRCARYAHGAPAARQRSAESGLALLAAMAAAPDDSLVAVLAQAALDTSEAAVGRSLAQAAACAEALNQTRWQVIDGAMARAGTQPAAAALAARLAELLQADEHVLPLKARLAEIERDAVALLTVAPPPPPPPPPLPPPPLPPPPPPPDPRLQLVDECEQLHLKAKEATEVLEQLKQQVASDDDLELTLSWRLQRRTRGH
ncbi:MAG TPA: phage resistance protein [Aquabacterium sp.]|nr:phage resistance protein [Aquabacterium sp.]HQC94916.1 phage resistance protein [Aquabacterium sp.]